MRRDWLTLDQLAKISGVSKSKIIKAQKSNLIPEAEKRGKFRHYYQYDTNQIVLYFDKLKETCWSNFWDNWYAICQNDYYGSFDEHIDQVLKQKLSSYRLYFDYNSTDLKR
jgi:hypothetical protein